MRFSAASPETCDAVGALLAEAFGGTGEAELVSELVRSGQVVAARVAEDDAGVAGYVLFSPLAVVIEGRRVRSAALAPLSVRADCRRRGIGAALVRAGLAQCATAGIQLVAVVGDPAYYKRFGFSPKRAEGLRSPFAGPACQVLELEAGARASGMGTMTYPEPFQRFVQGGQKDPGGLS